jgi:hypothetical protein
MNNLLFPAICVLFIVFGIYELHKAKILAAWICEKKMESSGAQATVSPAPNSIAVVNPKEQQVQKVQGFRNNSRR